MSGNLLWLIFQADFFMYIVGQLMVAMNFPMEQEDKTFLKSLSK